jgi:hypothetical protein
MDSSSFIEIAKLLLPEVLVDYFELTNHKTKGEELHFYFKEKNEHPKEFSSIKLSSKGFYPEAIIQDFPIRGKQVFLHITRRRWLNEDTHQAVSRNWDLVAQGTRITNEFAAFLKEISRY